MTAELCQQVDLADAVRRSGRVGKKLKGVVDHAITYKAFPLQLLKPPPLKDGAKPRGRLWLWRMICTASLLAIGGCDTIPAHIDIPQPKTVSSQDRAGTVLVSATMVAPWAEVQSNLAPTFSMNGTIASTLVLPTTQQASQQVLNATYAGLGISGPQISTTNTTSSQGLTSSGTTGNNGTTITTGGTSPGTTTTTTTTTTGSTSQQTNGSQTTTTTPGTLTAPASVLPTSLPSAPPAVALGSDPTLVYKDAAYLNQQVQTLNFEVTYAASRHCYVPYVVKLKLAFMPYVNPLAYSAHTQILFLQGSDDRPSTYTTPKSVRGSQAGCDDPGALPVVVPFLAADDLQIASISNTAEEARQIALAASIMASGATINASASNLYEAMTAIQNEAMHSALTVARSINNGLYVLIAPNNEATGSPALIGQTYDVEVLLLVPRSYFGSAYSKAQPAQISIITYTEFRDAKDSDMKDGDVLEDRSDAVTSQNILHVLKPFLTPNEFENLKTLGASDQESLVKPLVGRLTTANYGQFYNLLRDESVDERYDKMLPKIAPDEVLADWRRDFSDPAKQQKELCPEGALDLKNGGLCFPPQAAPALWATFTALFLDSPFKSADVEAPLPKNISVPSQEVVLSDDKSGVVSVVLSGVEGASASSLAAQLELTSVPNTAASDAGPAATPACPNPKKPKPGCSPAAPAKPVKLPPNQPITFAAQSLTLDPTAHTLTLTFPSPGKAGVTKLAPDAPGSPTNRLVFEQLSCKDTATLCPQFWAGTLPVDLQEIDTQPPTNMGFQLVNAGSTILFDKTGSANLPVTINSITPGVTVSANITGAVVTSVSGPSDVSGGSGGPIYLAKGGYILPGPGLYNIGLTNLPQGAIVTVTASGCKPTGASSAAACGPSPPAGGPPALKTGTATQTFVALPAPSAIPVKGN